MNIDQILLAVHHLKKYFPVRQAGFKKQTLYLKAVDDVSFDLYKGETLGIVGESGCGKSTLGRTLLRLYEKNGGDVYYNGKEIFSLDKTGLKALRKKIQMIFQDPFSSLNPRKNIFSLLSQPFHIHQMGSPQEIKASVNKLMQDVGLDPVYINRYPHQFSGGQRQRIGIARALALQPELIICDEAVSALDVSIQAQIINLLLDLQEKYHLTYIFIAHDLSVVEFIATRIIVMYLGKIVEIASKNDLISKRLHPYTRALFAASPEINPGKVPDKKIISGDIPSPIHPPSGCHFHPRCQDVMPICKMKYPEMFQVDASHHVACFLYSQNQVSANFD